MALGTQHDEVRAQPTGDGGQDANGVTAPDDHLNGDRWVESADLALQLLGDVLRIELHAPAIRDISLRWKHVHDRDLGAQLVCQGQRDLEPE